jgi:hypothetical protein
MGVENRFWQTLTILVMLLTVAVPTYVAYDLQAKGSAPEKKIEIRKTQTMNLMEDLSALGDKVDLSLRIENQVTDNLFIAKAWLNNVGTAPILPSDYYEKISVNVPTPWKILAVEDEKGFQSLVNFKWKRISDTKFEAEPALLNPKDMVSTNIYLTNTQFRKKSSADKRPEVKVEWKARIVNMKGFAEIPSFSIDLKDGGVSINLEGWSLAFTIITSMLFLALYLHLMLRAGFIGNINLRGIILIVAAGLLSFAAAESMSTYLYGSFNTKLLGVSHWLNAPWIIAHTIVIISLWLKAHRRQNSIIS